METIYIYVYLYVYVTNQGGIIKINRIINSLFIKISKYCFRALVDVDLKIN